MYISKADHDTTLVNITKENLNLPYLLVNSLCAPLVSSLCAWLQESFHGVFPAQTSTGKGNKMLKSK